MNTLHEKLNTLRKRLSECEKELKKAQKELKGQSSSGCDECDAFHKAVGSGSTSCKHKKRRLNRAKTPNNFWNLNF